MCIFFMTSIHQFPNSPIHDFYFVYFQGVSGCYYSGFVIQMQICFLFVVWWTTFRVLSKSSHIFEREKTSSCTFFSFVIPTKIFQYDVTINDLLFLVWSSCNATVILLSYLSSSLATYSHLSNNREGWNKRGGGAKAAKSINVEIGIHVEGGIVFEKLNALIQ